MYARRIAESGSVYDAFHNSQHPYTQALFSAIPIPDSTIEATRKHVSLDGSAISLSFLNPLLSYYTGL